MLSRAIRVWLVMMAVESLHGTFRRLVLDPWLGEFQARQISVISGAALVFGVALLLVRWIGAPTRVALFRIGVLWVALTALFETALGRALGLSWDRILSDYNLYRGGMMPFGLVVTGLSPALAARLRGVPPYERRMDA